MEKMAHHSESSILITESKPSQLLGEFREMSQAIGPPPPPPREFYKVTFWLHSVWWFPTKPHLGTRVHRPWSMHSQEICTLVCSGLHDDVIKWKHFPRHWPYVRGIHRWPVNSLHKIQWRGALMFSFICAWINGWVNNRKADDLRRHRAYYDVTVIGYNRILRGWYGDMDKTGGCQTATWNRYIFGIHPIFPWRSFWLITVTS